MNARELDPAPTFAVWYAADAPDDVEALTDVLQGDGTATVRHFDTLESWMASDADVLVVRGSARTGTPVSGSEELIENHDFESLKRRRVIGIGYEGGRIFSALRLDISGDYCMSFKEASPRILTEGDAPSNSGLRQTEILAFDAARLAGGPAEWDCLGLYAPKAGGSTQQVDVLARWESAPHHCPLARQGNMVLSGISADARTWTSQFSAVFREIAVSLAKSTLAPFLLSEWEVTRPGEETFRLAGCAQTEAPHTRSFFFRFTEPVLFSAELAMTEGGMVAMFFNGQATRRAARRVDATAGEPLSVLLPVTDQDLAANEGRYWILYVTNFDYNTPAVCTLHIRYGADAIVQLPGGLGVPLRDPPRDESTIETLIALVGSENAETSARAQAALLIVGEAAIPALKAASFADGVDMDLRVKFHMLAADLSGRF